MTPRSALRIRRRSLAGTWQMNWLLSTPRGRLSSAETAILEDWICFEEDGSELDDAARALLEQRSNLLRANPAIRIVIGGLADRRGTVAQGLRLGLRRIRSIRSFLLLAGIDPGRIGIAVRGSGWSVVERPHGSDDRTSRSSECRLQITDQRWTLARN